MYSYIKGKVIELDENFVVIEAGNSGVGYEITASGSVIANVQIGGIATIFTYLVVREDEMSLYGFFSIAEKNMFKRLISISGVGPKMAITVLSSMSFTQLSVCIMSGDIKTLSKVKGVGKKTAERIILELKEKLSNDDISMTDNAQSASEDRAVSDSLEILTSLGLSRSDVYTYVLEARKQSDDAGEIARAVLKRFGR